MYAVLEDIVLSMTENVLRKSWVQSQVGAETSFLATAFWFQFLVKYLDKQRTGQKGNRSFQSFRRHCFIRSNPPGSIDPAQSEIRW